MQAETPSTTAQIVAFARALADIRPHVPGFSDPIAKHFLGQPFRGLVDLAYYGFWAQSSRLFERYLGMIAANEFRAVGLDQAIAAAPAHSQLVILGAGLDSRAWRLDTLAGKIVFEIDHPATQAWKRQRARQFKTTAHAVRYVPVDFARDDLVTRLAAAGHDPQQPTFWLWEGVVFYLPPEAVAATMVAAAHCSAPQSTMAVSYLTELAQGPALTYLNYLHEPLVTAFKSSEFATFAAGLGWQTELDFGMETWRQMAPDTDIVLLTVGLQKHERIWIGHIAKAG